MGITSRERVLDILAGKETDRMACFSGMSTVTMAGVEALGLKFWQIHTDSRRMADAAMSSYRLYGMECAVAPFDICVEAEAMGCSANFYEGIDDEILFPTIRPVQGHLVHGPEDLKKVVVPSDFANKGRFPLVREALGLMKEDVGKEVAIGSWLLGPLTWLGQMMDLRLLLRLVYRKPLELVAVVDYLADAVVELAQKYREAGADYVCIREMTACSNMISPDSFRQIAQPSLIKIFKNIPSPHILHMCGHTNHIIADMEHCGADALSVETRNDLQLSRQAIGKEPLLFGHVDVAELMTQGTTVEVEQAVLESMAGGVDSIWPSCDVWPAAKPENMRAMVETVRKYGAQEWMRKS